MEKLCYVLWKPGAATTDAFARSMLDKVAPALAEGGAIGVQLNLVDTHAEAVAQARITHQEPPLAAGVSFWLDSADDRGPLEGLLAQASERLAGYLVVESVPLRNSERPAAYGERTDGISLFTCIERPERLDHASWIEHWHGHHRVVALEVQCTYLYVRNVVVRALTPDAPPWAGIVEEGFPAEAVTDPLLWYKTGGSHEKLKENLGRMLESVNAFLDIDRVESHPTSRYCMGAAPGD